MVLLGVNLKNFKVNPLLIEDINAIVERYPSHYKRGYEACLVAKGDSMAKVSIPPYRPQFPIEYRRAWNTGWNTCFDEVFNGGKKTVKTITPKQLAKDGESFRRIIDGGMVFRRSDDRKWVPESEASPVDYQRFPTVVRP